MRGLVFEPRLARVSCAIVLHDVEDLPAFRRDPGPDPAREARRPRRRRRHEPTADRRKNDRRRHARPERSRDRLRTPDRRDGLPHVRRAPARRANPGFHLEVIEGRFSDARRTPLLRVRGPLRSLLSAERVILNFLQHMCGVATQTHRFARRVEGTGARIVDTRKTLPGFRLLDKYAVRCGGGQNHRMGLHDGLLVKDNHIAHLSMRELAPYLTQVVAKSRAEDPKRAIEVEVDNLEQLKEVLKVDGGIDVILLDNMDCPSMTAAVEMRNLAGKKGKVQL